MGNADPRYAPVNALWRSLGTLPPFTREEAAKAAKAIARHFGRKSLGQPWQTSDFRVKRVRRCWINLKPLPVGDEIFKGLGRLCHDLSHQIYDVRVGPSMRRQHSAGHARLELEIAQFAIDHGMHKGALKPEPKVKPTTEQRRAAELKRVDAAILRWDAKKRRAINALTKLARRQRYLVKVLNV